MPRPKTKSELVSLSQSNFKKLLEFIDTFSPTEQERNFPNGTLNSNIKDVLAHLHHWHLMMREWYQEGMSGKNPAMPAKGYTWKTLPALNREIQKQYKNVSLDKSKKLLIKSFEEIQILIAKHSEVELFEKKRYKWTGSTSLAAYLISNTSSHYDWAIKLIKKCKKTKTSN